MWKNYYLTHLRTKMEGHPETITPPFSDLPPEMVLKVLGNLDHESLLSCRLVSKSWCEASSTILQSRPTVIVRSLVVKGALQERSLFNLIQCFKQSKKLNNTIPSTKFVFKGLDVKRSADLVSLLRPSNTCLNVKCLRFDDIHPCQDTMHNLRLLIFQGIPDLKILCLRLPCFAHSAEDVVNPKWKNFFDALLVGALPSLKILQLGFFHGTIAAAFVDNVLKAAPNLQRIESSDVGGFKGEPYYVDDPEHLQVLIDNNKLHLVKRCLLNFSEELVASGVLMRDKLSGFQPAFLRLIIPMRNFYKVKLALLEVLSAVKDTVEELEIVNILGLLDKLDVPRFSKLKRITWNLNKGNNPILPVGLRNRDVFPNLETIDFNLEGRKGEDGIFPDLSHIPKTLSVHNLKVEANGMIKNSVLEPMILMCPNLRSLEVTFWEVLENRKTFWKRPFIWKSMQGLKILVLSIKDFGKMYSLEMMEAAFTGFSLNTVRLLKAATPEDWPSLEVAEHLRVNPSILMLPDLEKLVLNLEGLNNEGRVPALSLSFKYGFNLLPGLTVKISSA